jgi:hypothetical protein
MYTQFESHEEDKYCNCYYYFNDRAIVVENKKDKKEAKVTRYSSLGSNKCKNEVHGYFVKKDEIENFEPPSKKMKNKENTSKNNNNNVKRKEIQHN